MILVQIPLWTIVTQEILLSGNTELRSDSSMDDCNRWFRLRGRLRWRVQIPLWTIVTRAAPSEASLFLVQIPLWTIVTAPPEVRLIAYLEFRFLYGRL